MDDSFYKIPNEVVPAMREMARWLGLGTKAERETATADELAAAIDAHYGLEDFMREEGWVPDEPYKVNDSMIEEGWAPE